MRAPPWPPRAFRVLEEGQCKTQGGGGEDHGEARPGARAKDLMGQGWGQGRLGGRGHRVRCPACPKGGKSESKGFGGPRSNVLSMIRFKEI